MHSKVSEETILILSCVLIYIYTKWKPPGVAFTYTWHFLSLLSAISECNAALGLSFCVGFALNFSWYMSQLIDSLLWPTLIPYWENYFPKWCQHTIIRIGDLTLHTVPLFFLLPYCRFITWKLCFYAFIFERFYFMTTENKPFGTGSVINIIYDFRPHLPRHTFFMSQYLTNLCYILLGITSIQSFWINRLCLFVCSCVIILVCIIHTDRLKIEKTNVYFEPVERYTMRINTLSEELQQALLQNIESIIQNKLDATAKSFQHENMAFPRFSIASFWENLPSGFDLTDLGVTTSEGRLVLWENFAEVASSILRVPNNWKSFEVSKAKTPKLASEASVTIKSLFNAILASFETNHDRNLKTSNDVANKYTIDSSSKKMTSITLEANDLKPALSESESNCISTVESQPIECAHSPTNKLCSGTSLNSCESKVTEIDFDYHISQLQKTDFENPEIKLIRSQSLLGVPSKRNYL